MPDLPLISVIIPCYNQGSFLDDAVSSCLEAWDGPLEIVIVDDGSTDPRTAGFLAALQVRSPARLEIVRQENGGLSRARNAGFAASTGDFVQFLDADDLLARNKLSHQMRQLQLCPAIDVSVSDYYTSDEGRGEVTAPPSSIAPFALGLEDFLFRWERGLSIPIHCALFRRRAFRPGHPPFVEGQRAKEDWLFWVELALRSVRLVYLPLRLCVYRLHGTNMTRSWSAMGLEWMKAAVQIDGWLAGRHPEFMGCCNDWYMQFYVARAPADSRSPAAAAPAAEPPPLLPLPPVEANATDEERAAAATISVVVPVFNHARYLRKCLRSAHAQSAPPREIVVVDDCSSDPAVRPLLRELAAETPGVKLLLPERNEGIAAAQNRAVAAATGDFVAFLDCDDFLHPDALRAVAAALIAHPEADYFFTDRHDVDADDRPLRHAVYGGYPDRPDLDGVSHRDNLLTAMVASHLKVIRRSRVLEAGGFSSETSGVQDWDLALKIAERGEFQYIAKPLYFHRIHARSVTLGQRPLMFRRTNEVRRRHQAVRAGKDARAPLDAGRLGPIGRFLAGGLRPGHDCAHLRWDAGLSGWRDPQADIAVVSTPRPLADAFRLWAASGATVFALPPRAPNSSLNFLREFNSYFDMVVCADETQWAVLHNYLWSPCALRLADELCAAPAG